MPMIQMDKSQIEALLRDGLSRKEISYRLQVGRSTLCRYLAKWGIVPRGEDIDRKNLLDEIDHFCATTGISKSYLARSAGLHERAILNMKYRGASGVNISNVNKIRNVMKEIECGRQISNLS